MKKLYISAFVLSALFFTGCSNDFLDTEQTEAISTTDLDLFNNDAGAQGFVTAIYSKFNDWDMSSFSWIGLTSIASDDADKGSSPGDTGSDKDLLDALTYNASSGSVEEVFTANYQGINRCNQALYYLPQLDKADANLRTRLTGEAKFLRAFMYFTLVKTYGGVPIVDHLPNPSSEADRVMQLTRKSPTEVYAFIVADLTDAIAALPTKGTYAASEKGRASQGAAYALLSKVYLYQKEWKKALDNANLVVGYSLVTDYASQYKLSGENDAESIFEIQGTGSTPAKGIQGYSATQGARGAGGWGWGFNTPSMSLVNAYENGDVRKNATIIFAGTTLYDGRVVPTTVENPRYNYKAYSSAYTDAWESDANIKYLRYAEVLLIKAEAMNELGQTTTAIPILNDVRKRAGLLSTTAVSQADVRTAIWKERRVEMAFEHDRFFDLVRTGQAKTAFTTDGKNFTVGKNEVFPLPQKFLSEANGLSTQNPGY
ncbi:RagB/SusD family nutrient uptake outer membrane protein [Flavobacterium muglaense]|uniref:RagB/SusD family nutrient uptake outer membrane protein n=1 Tax=Flavobacterium muglaense TaxID=2764716 RepID=A0A923N203_9FLAO|nr:RagB/SusD family nutrient uptake outer membrane protein [Flavobacterium muglaense]MBC5839347.1 RagB/SusD family nutrient uptake outer membrane protein [Flavobacterium muglaense]MBC5845859.1 RagB/SusD family nutrient uptake outer membrane protein [Flavobacterium muglaense]